jgi:aspartate/methionine/tyrosine aminotransferase
MLQTVATPPGARVAEDELARLIRAASPSTTIVLDECHDWLGPARERSVLRAAPNVIRVSSLSKTWSAPGLKTGWIIADSGFIDEYYEYASTTFGGPPSFFYTLVEVLARMERWILDGIDTPGLAELAEFEPSYGLSLSRLRPAYRAYREERLERRNELLVTRDATVVALTDASASVVPPRYSINITAEFPGYTESYLCFREILRRTGVSVLPGILTFCLSGAPIRVTTGEPWPAQSAAIDRLRAALVTGAGR